nr:CopD family protein [Pseudonocardia sp. C8]
MLLATEIHVLAATAWVGGLAALVAFAARRHGLLAVALPRFSRLAGLCLAGVAVSGVVAGALGLGTASPSALLSTTYGGLILAKIGVTAAVAVIGAHMRRRLVRRALQGRPERFAAWATAELALMGVAFGIAVVLGHSGG